AAPTPLCECRTQPALRLHQLSGMAKGSLTDTLLGTTFYTHPRLPMRPIVIILSATIFVFAAMAKDEYTGRYLYAETNPDDQGGIAITLTADSPVLRHAIAVGHRSQSPYKGE